MPNLKHTVVIIDNKVAKVRNVDEKQYNDLLNQQHKHEELELQKELERKQVIINIEGSIKDLQNKNFHLAKSIYDNFVDRGLIDDNSDFQKAYYNYVFNGKEIKIEDTPTDFQTIYRKVCD